MKQGRTRGKDTKKKTNNNSFDKKTSSSDTTNGIKLVNVDDNNCENSTTTPSSSSFANTNNNSRQNSKQEKSRVVYVASACHTCKALPDSSKGIKLSSCAGCRMLNYCSRQHQIDDWKSHKVLCTQLQKVLKMEQKTYLYEGCDNLRTEAEWLQIRYSYMKLLSDQLGRELEAYEKEIFLFPLYFCFTCNQTKLALCEICHHHHHNSVLSSKPEKTWCEELRVWLDIVCWESHHGLIKPLCSEDEAAYPINDLATDFPDDIHQYFSIQKIPPDLPHDVWRATIADIATVPLTIIWTLIQFAPHLTKLDSLTIHLIGAEQDFEGCCPTKWEFCFVHLLKTLSNLHVVLIGPELVPGTSTPLLCTTCRNEGRQLTITNKPGIFYHEYTRQKAYVRPNIICAFNCGIYRKTGFNGQDTWAATVPLLGNTDLFIDSAYTDSEISHDARRILSECQGLELLSGQFRKRNPYRSLRPQRTLINEDAEPLMYKNQYVAVFKKEAQ